MSPSPPPLGETADSHAIATAPRDGLTGRLQAVGYALNHWAALKRFADVPIDTNLSERELRPVAVGRKNWLFAGSDEFSENGAVLFSFTATCKANGVDPWAWMADVLARLSTVPDRQRVTLLPDEWAKAREIAPKK